MKAGRTRRAILTVGALLAMTVPIATGARAAQDLPRPKLGETAPDISFTSVDGKKLRLSDFRGKPVMLWLIATWCPTCQASARVLAEHKEELEKAGLVVITLRLYKNLGYDGPEIAEFAKRWAPSLKGANWYWGDAGEQASYIYDPRGYPDIYWLVDRDGSLWTVNTAPNATLEDILSFASGS